VSNFAQPNSAGPYSINPLGGCCNQPPGRTPGFPLPQRFTETRGPPTSIAASVLPLARRAGTALWDVLLGRCAGVRRVPIGLICAAIARIARTSAGRADIKIPARTGANVQPLRLDRLPCFQYSEDRGRTKRALSLGMT
jgi:hypothetical protein